jgi:hypothetical protein
LSSDPNKFPRKHFRFEVRLFRARWVPLGALRGVDYGLPRFAVKCFELSDITIQLTGICADELVTFSHL